MLSTVQGVRGLGGSEEDLVKSDGFKNYSKNLYESLRRVYPSLTPEVFEGMFNPDTLADHLMKGQTHK